MRQRPPICLLFVIPTQQPGIKPGKALAREIERSIAAKLMGSKSLAGGVYFINQYPTTGFKIHRRALKVLKGDKEIRFVIEEGGLWNDATINIES